MQSRNYIEQNKANENYRLGIRCLELGQTFIHQRGMLKQAKPVLQELAAKTGETSYVSILRGNQVVYLDSVEPATTVRVVSRLGLHMPTHATAAGKGMVAFESEEDIRKRLDPEFQSYTQNTIRTAEDLLRNLSVVREKGYATDLEEFEEGLRCIASPIRDYTRKVIGALSVSGPANRVTDDRIETVLSVEVIRLAKELSILLGYRE